MLQQLFRVQLNADCCSDQALPLAQKLEFDAAVEGLTLEDLEIQRGEVETYIRDIISHVGEPGTSGA